MHPLDMTSEFQLDPLLLLRPSSPGEDEILPAITALYLSSSSDSVSGSERDVEEQDCEWREAIRVALEEDLQRQVRLKLGLDSGYTQHHRYRSHALPTLSWRLKGLRLHPTLSLTPHMLCCNRPQKVDVQERDKNMKWQHAGRSDVPSETGGDSEKKEGGKGGEEGREVGGGSRPTGQLPPGKAGIFKYLHSKYGTPLEQLKHLAVGGSFQTSQSECSLGAGGVPIRWPVEANIIVPTPQHIWQHGAYLEPMSTFTEGSTATDVQTVPHPSHPSNMANVHHEPHPPHFSNMANVHPEPHPPHFSSMANVHPEPHPPHFSSMANVHPEPHPSNLSSMHPEPCQSSSDGASKRRRIVYSNSGQDTVEPCHSVLSFESRFEGGNLQQASQVGAHEYNLMLRTDLYTKKHTQWYYFRVRNMKSGVTYTFNIINLMKADSLYNYGMQPLLYSECEVEKRGVGWRRVGHDIRYYCNAGGARNPLLPALGEYYTLTWKMEFPHSVDTCYLAHCYPYSYSTLLGYLTSVEQCPLRGRYVRKEVLCHTLAGNPCYLVTITDFDAPPDIVSCRKGVVISSRVHPGETNSSWMMEGVMQCLTADTTHAKSLRNHFVFKLVPMLNPDGVIVGNYRTSLTGVDLNRVYKNPVEVLFPTVFHTKKMIADFMQERELLVYVDLHGHSRKHNVFTYGCHVPQCDHTHFLNERVLPFLLSQETPDMFSFRSCKFKVHRSKEATGRVVVWRMGVANSFTMEATFCGSTLGTVSHQFTEGNLIDMGIGLCKAIHKYHRFTQSKGYQQRILSALAEHIIRSIEKKQLPTDCSPDHPSGAASDTNPPVPLPDIVTSSLAPGAENKPSKKHHSKHLSKRILRKFSKYNLSLLEEESSTSGSDSENDEFEYSKKKHSRHKKRRRRRSLHTHTQPHLLHSTPSRTLATNTHLHTSPPSTSPLPTSPPSRDEKLVSLKLHSSAPARLQSLPRKKMLPTGWKFVNRYANRSNKGIPMFAEERLKERAEKQRLQSMSMIEPDREQTLPDQFHGNLPTITQPHPHRSHPLPTLLHRSHPFPTPLHRSHTLLTHPYGPQPSLAQPHKPHSLPPQPHKSHPLPTHPHGLPSIKAIPPFLWRPVESQKDEENLKQLNSLRHPPPSSFAYSSSSLHHYERIKDLVEGREPKRPPPPCQLGVPPLTSHHVTARQFQRLWQEGKKEGSLLSPQLAKYISEVWGDNTH